MADLPTHHLGSRQATAAQQQWVVEHLHLSWSWIQMKSEP
jgi:hypothetical protein